MGASAPPKVFDLNMGKNAAQSCLTSKNGTQKSWTFLEVAPKKGLNDLCGTNFVSKTLNFPGKFGKVGKMFRAPKNLPAPSPMLKRHLHTHCSPFERTGENAPVMPPFSGVPAILHALYLLVVVGCNVSLYNEYASSAVSQEITVHNCKNIQQRGKTGSSRTHKVLRQHSSQLV